MYEDLGLLTADQGVTADISNLFNNLSGFARQRDYPHLLVAPESVRTGLIDRVTREIDHRRAGRPARIRIKVNSLVDEATIDALYQASRAGVQIELWVRGISEIRPGVPDLSDHITVRSILGRFLEHSRIFWFENGGEHEAWIGSADLMHRNLDRRVEVLVNVPSRSHVDELGRLLDLALADGTASWWLRPDGEWERHAHSADGERLVDLQSSLIAMHRRHREAPSVGRR
jgi:polyphosphate kinase